MRSHHSILAVAIVAFAATQSAAASDYYLKLGDIKGEVAGGDGGGGMVEVQSFHWGPRQTTSADGSRTRTGNLMTMDDRAGQEKLQPGGGSAQGQTATNLTSSKSNAAREIAVSDPGVSAQTGQLTVMGSFAGCAVGKRYASAQFGGASMRYELKDVVITNCAPDGLSLDYGKVTVRGWDPKKKEE